MAHITKSGNPKAPARADKMYSQGRIDPYESRKKLPDPTRCPTCKAVFLKGRWTWETVPDPVKEELCPACRRIKDRVAAGIVELSGPFFEEHRAEIESLINNQEKLEKERHPLERMMAMKPAKGGLRIETTGHHLARRLGNALKDAYQGELEIEYLKGQEKVRINWER
ncbi:MAG: BCAM0308 family protein [Anaerolineales bacterium]